ncbi:MAG: hypothetical protein WAL71_06990, partial [Terriglobales bacterium]
MKRIFVLAMFMFLSIVCLGIVCYAAEAPLQCASAVASESAAAAQSPSSQSAAASQSNDDVIFFLISASTNTPAVCYTVSRSGTVIKQTGASRFQRAPGQAVPAVRQGSIPASVAEKIFSDVESAMPLSALPKEFCAKSVSFGTSQHVFFKGEK